MYDNYEDNELTSLEERLLKFQEDQNIRDAIEERDALLHLKSVIATNSGRNFMKYLIKSFDVGELPDRGVEGAELHETMGFLRAGQSIFKMVAHANTQIAGEILADIEGEKQDDKLQLTKIENGK